MDKATLKNRIKTLNQIKKLKADKRGDFLKDCSSECIHTICEACYNLLNGGVKVKQLQRIKNILQPHRFDIRKLANPKISVNTKRKILSKPQDGDGIFTMLASTVIPAILSSLLSK